MQPKTLRTAITILLTILLVACADQRDHVANARNYLAQGDTASATIELKNALKENPQNSAARWLLGELYFNKGDIDAAAKEIDAALAAGHPESVAAPLLAQLWLDTGEDDRLQQLPIKGLAPADRSTVLAAKALSAQRADNPGGAKLGIEAALENSPVSAFAMVAAARISTDDGNTVLARRQLGEAVAIDATYAPAWSRLGDIAMRERKYEEATEAYSKALAIAPHARSDRFNRALIAMFRQDLEAVQKDIAILMKSNPAHPGVNVVQGILKLEDGKMDEAQILFERAAEYGDSYPLSYYYLSAVQMRQGNMATALYNARRFIALLPTDPRGLKLAATIELRQENYAAAEELVRPVVDFYPDDLAALSLLANALVGQGKNEGAALLTEISEREGLSPQLRANLGSSLFTAGEIDLGVEALQAAIELDPDYERAEVLLVSGYLRNEDYDAATKAALAYVAKNPEKPGPYNVLGRVYAATADLDKAETAFENALEADPENREANYNLAEIALLTGRYDDARQRYKTLLERDPGDEQTYMKLAVSYEREGNTAAMLATLQQAVKEAQPGIEARLALGRYYLSEQQPERVFKVFAGLTDPEKERPDVLEVLALSEFSRDNFNNALRYLDRLVQLKPDVDHYRYLRAKTYGKLGDQKKLTTEINQVLELNPDHFSARVVRARLAILAGDRASFQTDLDYLRKKAPDNPSVLNLEITAARQAGDTDRVVELAEAVFSVTPSTQSLTVLASNTMASGDSAKAIAQLEAWIEKHPDDIKIREMLAEIEYQAGRTDNAVAQYRAVLEIDSDNLGALNNQAWILLDSDPAQAQALAERALTLAPRSASVMDTLAVAQLNNKQVSQARRTIDRAMDIAPGNTSVLFNAARIRAAQGETEAATDILGGLLARDDTFSHRADAEQLMKELRR